MNYSVERMVKATLMAPVPLALCVLLSLPLAVQAAPGAHGPNGEHLDGPATPAAASTSSAPKLEAHSETFELVATLAGGELSMLIDRYSSNEPVLHGQVEVESDGIKAIARFHADHGDYAIDDARLLQALAKPGQHPMVFTITAGDDTDLLDGVLVVKQAVSLSEPHDHGHDHADHDDAHAHASINKAWWVVGGLTLLAAVAWLGSIWRKGHKGRQERAVGSPVNTTGRDA